ncbi:hypothetical protein AZI98_08985 [Aeribacillus pallidus]|uniref:Uncharacterized protein n=1 Tax=Aeribacillus pallidus TaxID=33936 RepID=A0A165XM81_9BACI|nr:hypothetical protein AZI98_08985 [Aeribacillus pallidus]
MNHIEREKIQEEIFCTAFKKSPTSRDRRKKRSAGGRYISVMAVILMCAKKKANALFKEV